MKRRVKQEPEFAVCINNENYEASLESGKLYRVIPDGEASSHGYIRVIDESGEDYGYSVDRFFPLEVPQALKRALASSARLLSEDSAQARGARRIERSSSGALSEVRKVKRRAADRY